MEATTGDPIIGRSMRVEAAHAGHTVTVERRDQIEKHRAYWLRCSCGKAVLIGEDYLPDYIESGVLPHEVMRGQW